MILSSTCPSGHHRLPPASDGLVAERLRSGLQIRVLGFESRPSLQGPSALILVGSRDLQSPATIKIQSCEKRRRVIPAFPLNLIPSLEILADNKRCEAAAPASGFCESSVRQSRVDDLDGFQPFDYRAEVLTSINAGHLGFFLSLAS